MSNLVTVNRVPFSRNGNQVLSLCLLNLRSVRNKTALIFDYVYDCKADLVLSQKHGLAIMTLLFELSFVLMDTSYWTKAATGVGAVEQLLFLVTRWL